MRAQLLIGFRIAGAALALTAAACAAEDDWVVRPPGPGTGGTGGGGVDAGGGGGGDITGRLCVVDDLRLPDACPSTPAAAGVRIRVVGGVTITTDASGRFSLPAPTAPQVLEIGGTSPALVPGVARLVPGGGLALRVARASAFQDVLDAVGVPGLADQAGIVIYVDDTEGDPLPGVVFAGLSGAAYPPMYDDGAATLWRLDGGTGVAGVALMLGVPVLSGDGYTVTGQTAGGEGIPFAGVPVRANAVTFVRTATTTP